MHDLSSKIQIVKDNIAIALNQAGRQNDEIKVICATKMQSAEDIANCLKLSGYTIAGENKVQELVDKYPLLPDIEWHIIGQLQSNKVKYIIDKVTMIHSLDRMSLASEIDKRAKEIDKIMDCLVEINICGDLTKGGIMPDDTLSFVKSVSQYSNINIKGVMTVLPLETSPQFIPAMQKMRQLSLELQSYNHNADVLSMGMSGDYMQAIQHGATMIRLGTALFGNRQVR